MPMEELLAMYGVGATSSLPPSHFSSSAGGGGDAPASSSLPAPSGGPPRMGGSAGGCNGAGDGARRRVNEGGDWDGGGVAEQGIRAGPSQTVRLLRCEPV